MTQVVPKSRNDPTYLAYFEQLLAALGRRYDGDERLSVFEFSGYGDFSENHIAYLRDTLHVPAPLPEQSVKALGYFSQFLDQNITIASIGGNWSPHTSTPSHTPQSVMNVQSPEIVREFCLPTMSLTSWPHRWEFARIASASRRRCRPGRGTAASCTSEK